MTTVVNNPGGGESGSGMGMVLGVIVVLALAFLFIVYGLPMMRQTAAPATPSAPAAPQVNIPDKLDVNVTNK